MIICFFHSMYLYYFMFPSVILYNYQMFKVLLLEHKLLKLADIYSHFMDTSSCFPYLILFMI